MDRLRAIDALIAQHLMESPKPTTLPNVIYDRMRVGSWHLMMMTCSPLVWVPTPYSSDPAASKQARDKMREKGWNWNSRWRGDDPRSSANGLYSVEFWRGAEESYGERHVTEELAVALAILAALGVEVPE